MGNLRDKYTNEEWDEMTSKYETERNNGRPEKDLIYFNVFNKSALELQEIKNTLLKFYEDYQLNNLDEWINYKNKL